MAAPDGTAPRRLRVVFMGTHPAQFNGYAVVVWNLARALHARHGHAIELHLFGFQNFHTQDAAHIAGRRLPDDVRIYDAAANETPRELGFGVKQVKAYVTEVKPDVVIVFNDMMIITAVLAELRDAPNRADFKIVPYIDQVYLCQRRDWIRYVSGCADAAIMFTAMWEECIVRQGLALPRTYWLPHGFNSEDYHPVPRHLARRYFNLADGDFCVLNLNRNTPRKRYDTLMKVWAEVVLRMRGQPVRLVIATDVRGAWDVFEIFERELNKRGITLADGMQHVVVVESPQRLTDAEVNALYNATDLGINTCDGEGFGLCNFQHAAVGVPQVVPRLGGFLDFFDDTCATLIDPKIAYYSDTTRDPVGGEALLCDYADFADAVQKYYADPALRQAHGRAARARILPGYTWPAVADKFADIVFEVSGRPRLPVATGPVVTAPAPAPAPAPLGSTASAGDADAEGDADLATVVSMLHGAPQSVADDHADDHAEVEAVLAVLQGLPDMAPAPDNALALAKARAKANKARGQRARGPPLDRVKLRELQRQLADLMRQAGCDGADGAEDDGDGDGNDADGGDEVTAAGAA